MSLPIILLAAQAAGLALDLYGTRRASKSLKMGYKIDQANSENRLEQLRLQSTEEASFNLDQLRRNLSTQRAISGARGQASGMGSARGALNASERAYSSDERAREMSLRFKTFDMKQEALANRISNQAQRRQLSQGFMGRALQTVSSNGVMNALNELKGTNLSGTKKAAELPKGLKR